MFRTMTIAIAFMAGATAAQADVAAGDACAANLTPTGKTIYAAVIAANPTLQNLRDIVRSKARGMVMGGQLSREAAEENAVPAGECVRARLQQ